MKRYFLGIVLMLFCVAVVAQESEFYKKLSALPGVSNITPLKSRYFTEKYEVFITQQTDHGNPSAGTFLQRVVVGYTSETAPTVMVTEGYRADYALYPTYSEELTELLKANMVFCEHRYFSKSVPEPCNWDYMTVDNSTADLHNIRETFGKIFTGKWVSTGISKGGSTCTYYREAYPNDVDASVAYVAPISRALEDGRHEKFLNKKVSNKENRNLIHEMQREYMSRKPRLVAMLDTFCTNRQYKFSRPIGEIYDYEVLELEFSFWQWGRPISQIPKKYENDAKWFNYLVDEVGPEYFVCGNEYLPFYYQAMHELGYYGYDIKNLGKQNVSLTTTKNYLKEVMVSENMRYVEFDPTICKRTCEFLKKNDPTHIFIYGANDPWTASGVAGWLNCKKKQNMKIYVEPNGSHLARIKTLPENDRKEIMEKLNNWLK